MHFLSSKSRYSLYKLSKILIALIKKHLIKNKNFTTVKTVEPKMALLCLICVNILYNKNIENLCERKFTILSPLLSCMATSDCD